MAKRLLSFICFFTTIAVHPAAAHPGAAIAVDAKGQVYFVDTGHGVWTVDAAGKLVDLGGPAFHWMALDPDGRFAGLRVLRIEQGKGQRDRYVMLSPRLLEILREWWKWRRPRHWLFPGEDPNEPITTGTVARACQLAHWRSGLTKPVSPHALRHYLPFLTMSSNIGPLSRSIRRFRSKRRRCEPIARHSLGDAIGC